MLEQKLRQTYQLMLVSPVLNRLHCISPSLITWMSGFFGLLFIPFLLMNKPLISVTSLLLSGYLDTLDGSLARHQQRTSDLGSMLDIVMDRVVEFAVIFGLYLFNPARALFVILMLGSILLCITSFLVVGIFTDNNSSKSFHYSPGLMERAEAFIFFILMTLIPSYFKPLATIFCILVSWTAFIRLLEFKHFKERANP